jgi:hypothetical protein
LSLGLPRDERRRALIGLSSSLRNVGRAAEAVAVLEGPTLEREFEGDAAMESFLALAWHSAGRSDEAVARLLWLLIKKCPVEPFGRALNEYATELVKK